MLVAVESSAIGTGRLAGTLRSLQYHAEVEASVAAYERRVGRLAQPNRLAGKAFGLDLLAALIREEL